MLKRVLLAAAACGATAAHGADGRLRTLFYEPERIVTIAGRPDIQSTIVFAPDERVENVALGDSAAWQVTPNKRANLLFIKPQAPRGRTNMTVVTDRRTYLFDLVAQGRGGPALYALRFTYPAPPPSPPSPLAPERSAPPPAPPPAPPATPADLDSGWTARGAARLLPDRVFDDGKAMYLSWKADVPLPAMLAVAPDGGEGPVNYSVRGDVVVVDGVPGRLVLRSGKDVAMLDHHDRPARAAGAETAAR